MKQAKPFFLPDGVTSKDYMAALLRCSEEGMKFPGRKVPLICGVYFVRSGDYVKIGWSKDVYKRLPDIQVASPQPLIVLSILPSTSKAEERVQQRKRKDLHARGEWFRYEPKRFPEWQPMALEDIMRAYQSI